MKLSKNSLTTVQRCEESWIRTRADSGVNDILERTVYRHQGEGGTYIVPGHGYLDEHEVGTNC
jgi:hypothetical protein